ncbi:MAG: hypothetical protein ACXVAY_19540 [Mucilaginibacter sp.]
MKTVKLSIAVLILTAFVQRSIAQDGPIGLYLTLADYQNHKVNFETSTNTIRLNTLFETKDIVVWHDGKREILSKKDVFGYRFKNEDYRFFNNQAYKIVDTKDFYLYSKSKLVQQGKGMKPVEIYYFSDAANSPIAQLSIRNLEVAYARNLKFKYTVEQYFKSDDELIAYDNAIKEYKLKYLFEQSSSK